MWLAQGAAPGKCRAISGFLGGGDRTRLRTLEKPVLLHPGNQLVGMIGFLERMLGEDRLPAPVMTKRIAQAQSLGETTRTGDELVGPLQSGQTLCTSQALKERPLSKL